MYSIVKVRNKITREEKFAVYDEGDATQPYGIIDKRVMLDTSARNRLLKDINKANVKDTILSWYLVDGIRWVLNHEEYEVANYSPY